MNTYSHYDFAEYDKLPQQFRHFLPQKEKERVNHMKKQGNTHCLFYYCYYYMLAKNLVFWGIWGFLFSPEKVSKNETGENLLL